MAEIDPTLPHYDVRVFLSEAVPGREFDDRFAALVGLPVGPSYSTDLDAVVGALNLRGWWWSLSHMQAVVIPNGPVLGMEGLLGNAEHSDREGRPIEYKVHFAKEYPALSLCCALVKAMYDLPAAYYVCASAVEVALAREPWSEEHMMQYYKARESLRQQQIRDYEERHGDAVSR